MFVVEEGRFGSRQVELPHAEEAFVVEPYRLFAARDETLPPGPQGPGIVHRQDLDILHQQPHTLDRRQNLGESGNITAGEDVLFDPRVGRPGLVDLADRMQQHDAFRRQQLLHLVEEISVIADADMLEHADGDDAVELPVLKGAVVLQFEADTIGKPAPGGTITGNLQLLLAERDARDFDSGGFGQIHSHPAPAGTDLQHLLPRLQQKLRGDVPLLGELCCVERYSPRLEIGAGILPVLVEEQVEEIAIEIVVMGDVVPVAIDRHAAHQLLAQYMPQACDRVGGICRILDAVRLHDRKHVEDVTSFDDDAPIHVHFTKAKARIPDDRLLCFRIDDADRCRFSGAVTQNDLLAGRKSHRQIAVAHQTAKQSQQCCIHISPLPDLPTVSWCMRDAKGRLVRGFRRVCASAPREQTRARPEAARTGSGVASRVSSGRVRLHVLAPPEIRQASRHRAPIHQNFH
ncbi:hypothetical protein D9M68_282430 [compost metagenome]